MSILEWSIFSKYGSGSLLSLFLIAILLSYQIIITIMLIGACFFIFWIRFTFEKICNCGLHTPFIGNCGRGLFHKLLILFPVFIGISKKVLYMSPKFKCLVQLFSKISKPALTIKRNKLLNQILLQNLFKKPLGKLLSFYLNVVHFRFQHRRSIFHFIIDSVRLLV